MNMNMKKYNTLVILLTGINVGASEVQADPMVGIEKSNRPNSFQHLPLPTNTVGALTANQKLAESSLATLLDGKLTQGYGAVFNNGVKNGAYKMDLGQAQPVAAITSWSYNEGGKRGAQKLTIYGSNSATDPGWDLNALEAGSQLTVLKTQDEKSWTLTASKFMYNNTSLLNNEVEKNIDINPHLPYLYIPNADFTHFGLTLNNMYAGTSYPIDCDYS